MVKLAGFKGKGKNRKPWVNPKLKEVGAYRRVGAHQREYLESREKGFSRAESIARARKAEHKGMTKKQVQQYEGKLGALAKKRK